MTGRGAGRLARDFMGWKPMPRKAKEKNAADPAVAREHAGGAIVFNEDEHRES